MILNFTDNDFAVIQDSLGTNRERIRDMGRPTPNMDETMKKWGRWAKPSGCEFTVVTGEDAIALASKEAMVVVITALIQSTNASGLEEACHLLSTLPVANDENVARLVAVMRDEAAERKALAQ
jgi:hypothetical protein